MAIAGEYEVGSQAPEGYRQWHEWAEVQYKAGLRQTMCPGCKKFMFPQEVDEHKNCLRDTTGAL